MSAEEEPEDVKSPNEVIQADQEIWQQKNIDIDTKNGTVKEQLEQTVSTTKETDEDNDEICHQ